MEIFFGYFCAIFVYFKWILSDKDNFIHKIDIKVTELMQYQNNHKNYPNQRMDGIFFLFHYWEQCGIAYRVFIAVGILVGIHSAGAFVFRHCFIFLFQIINAINFIKFNRNNEAGLAIMLTFFYSLWICLREQLLKKSGLSKWCYGLFRCNFTPFSRVERIYSPWTRPLVLKELQIHLNAFLNFFTLFNLN